MFGSGTRLYDPEEGGEEEEEDLEAGEATRITPWESVLAHVVAMNPKRVVLADADNQAYLVDQCLYDFPYDSAETMLLLFVSSRWWARHPTHAALRAIPSPPKWVRVVPSLGNSKDASDVRLTMAALDLHAALPPKSVSFLVVSHDGFASELVLTLRSRKPKRPVQLALFFDPMSLSSPPSPRSSPPPVSSENPSTPPIKLASPSSSSSQRPLKKEKREGSGQRPASECSVRDLLKVAAAIAKPLQEEEEAERGKRGVLDSYLASKFKAGYPVGYTTKVYRKLVEDCVMLGFFERDETAPHPRFLLTREGESAVVHEYNQRLIASTKVRGWIRSGGGSLHMAVLGKKLIAAARDADSHTPAHTRLAVQDTLDAYSDIELKKSTLVIATASLSRRKSKTATTKSGNGKQRKNPPKKKRSSNTQRPATPAQALEALIKIIKESPDDESLLVAAAGNALRSRLGSQRYTKGLVRKAISHGVELGRLVVNTNQSGNDIVSLPE